MSDIPDDAIVKLISNADDGPQETISVTKKVAFMSETVKNLIEDLGCVPDDPIPLNNVSGPNLKRVEEYCNRHVNESSAEDSDEKKRPDYVSEEDKAFTDKLNMEELCKLILVANFMDIKPLLELTCKTIALQVKGKNQKEIMELFGVEKPFTPEEVAKVLEENPWAKIDD